LGSIRFFIIIIGLASIKLFNILRELIAARFAVPTVASSALLVVSGFLITLVGLSLKIMSYRSIEIMMILNKLVEKQTLKVMDVESREHALK